ncbi:MgtC/SapB family protein [Arthrobacter sp. M2012083]|uniref:MgtC/SapB family protein n=1 Tax=Arthrobacter sp. M2012083 TaxID=1197706 RepID=UPI0003045BA0|nr:MgtC/SapB family protein [Arthrobacter sp. M2012083]
MIFSADTQWWHMCLALAVALVLSTAIGFERQSKNKSAGMRTHAMVGLGAALFMVVSKYGFSDVLAVDLVRLDPSRLAAQVVSGIGFIGAGLVFVRRNQVRGLTTAASVWVTAAVGTAAGAGLVFPAVFVTAAHFIIVYVYPVLTGKLRFGFPNQWLLRVSYVDGVGALRDVLHTCTEQGFRVQGFATMRGSGESKGVMDRLMQGTETAVSDLVEIELEIEGTMAASDIVAKLSQLSTVTEVSVVDEVE